jgi:purine-nucleoside phosphorylase
MSTTREVEAAFELGLECAAVSCITNRAAGLSPHRLSHQDVLDMSARQARRLGDLIEAILKSLAA